MSLQDLLEAYRQRNLTEYVGRQSEFVYSEAWAQEPSLRALDLEPILRPDQMYDECNYKNAIRTINKVLRQANGSECLIIIILAMILENMDIVHNYKPMYDSIMKKLLSYNRP